MPESLQIREGTRADLPVLEAMLFEAFHWNTRLPRADIAGFKQHPEFRKLLDEWGERDGDMAVIAEIGGKPIGAAWYRFWSPDLHSYGFVDAETPEVALGVDRDYRRQGAGRALMKALSDSARAAGIRALSLSVDRDNFAVELYRSLGFRPVGTSGTSMTLVLAIEPKRSGEPS